MHNNLPPLHNHIEFSGAKQMVALLLEKQQMEELSDNEKSELKDMQWRIDNYNPPIKKV